MNKRPPANGVLDWREKARQTAYAVRRAALEFTIRSSGGYLSQACSAAEIFAALYTKIMRLGPSRAPLVPAAFAGVPGANNPGYMTGAAYNGPHEPHLDRFFLSCVQYALALYVTLVELGRMAADGLAMFNRDGSTVEMIGAEHSPGHEITGGSLGQALSQVAGIALGRRLNGETGRQWVLMSDGEFQSGQTWETIQALSFYKLDNIGVYVDVNGQQCDGEMTEVMNIEPLAAKLEAFGARVYKVDGHDPEALAAPAEASPDGRPLFVLAYTNPAQGMAILDERKPKLHYVRFKDERERQRFRDFLAQETTG
ncbi:MAG: transketolase [Candidatus Aminicenantes bacterium]|nr:transketolase [Candidatus Aminicenantes bacterium]